SSSRRRNASCDTSLTSPAAVVSRPMQSASPAATDCRARLARSSRLSQSATSGRPLCSLTCPSATASCCSQSSRQVDEQSQVLGHERPALVNLVPRPLPLHRPPPSARSRRLRIASRTHHPSMAILHSFAVTGPLYGLPPITARSRRAFDRFAHIQYLTILLSTPGLRFQFWYQNWKRNRQPVGGGERRKAAFSAGPTLISSKALSRGQPTTG